MLSFLLVQLGLNAVNPPTDLNGEALKNWLKENFYDGKHITLGYDGSNGARSKMYNYIDNKNNVITGVYSGYQVDWTYGGTGTNPAPINCEHTVPQSYFGKAEPMKSDIHHLFPTYGSWNSTRSNYPFDEIDDNETDKWMYMGSSIASIPSSNINEYSEYASSRFEPREDHKGNCARAIFYFYTMYPTQAGDIGKVADIEVLYDWHLNDPVDAAEIKRNDDIEKYQGDRNPYIDYPELVARAFGLSDPSTSAPATPSLQFSASKTSIELSWTNVYNENGYLLYKSENGGTYTNIASMNPEEASYTDNAVSAETPYAYYVIAYNDNGNSGASNEVSGMLQEDADDGSGSNSDIGSNNGVGEATELFVSEYVEGSSYNKAIEIANYTNAPADLSAYSLRVAFNGADNWGNTMQLSGTLEAGDVYLVANAGASFVAQADETNGSVINFNGNDAIGLFKNGVLIDMIGTLGSSSDFAKDKTLVRKPTVKSPNAMFDMDEWDQYKQDEFSYLGSHTIDVSTDINFNIAHNSNLTLYPNPGTSVTNIKIKQKNIIEQLKICIYNMNGSMIYSEKQFISGNTFESQLDVSSYNKGIYLVKVKTTDFDIIEKLVIE